MKARLVRSLVALLCAAAAAAAQSPLGSEFTYQGRLELAGSTPSGTADFEFRLFDTASAGAQVADTATATQVELRDGLFSTTIDFGPAAFDGSSRFLEIAVRAPAGHGQFVTLAPRQPITAAPHARFAAGPWRTNDDAHLSYAAGSVSIAGADDNPALSLSREWDGENGALALTGDRPTLRFSGGQNAGNQSWIAHLGTDGPGKLGLFNRVGDGAWAGVVSLRPAALPGSRVEIHGQDGLSITGFQPFLTLRDTGSQGSRALVSSGNGDLGFYTESAIGRSPSLLIKNETGAVGIGTPSPTAARQLEVRTAMPYPARLESSHPIASVLEVRNTSVPATWEFSVAGANPGFQLAPGSMYIWKQDTLSPQLDINPAGFVGLSVRNPLFRLELPNAADESGRARSSGWVTYSSARWKENVRTLDGALGKLMRLRGVSFDWKPEHGGAHDIGFVAEEVGEVVPEVVSWEADGAAAAGLAYDRLTALAVEAIKEQQAQIDELRRQNQELSAQLAQLARAVTRAQEEN